MGKSKNSVDSAEHHFRRTDKPYFTEKTDYKKWLDDVQYWANEIVTTPPDDDGLTDDFGHMIKTHILNAIKRIEIAIDNNDIPEIMFCMHWLMVRMYDGEIIYSTNSLRIFNDAQKKGQETKNAVRDDTCKNIYNDYHNLGRSKETVMSDYDIKSDSTFYRMVNIGKNL